MKQLHLTDSSIFSLPKEAQTAICITTNGIVKKNGEAVMGAGIAKGAVNTYDGIAKDLGNNLSKYGNHVFYLGSYETDYYGTHNVFSFPTKHHWRDASDINLIKRSAQELADLCDNMNITTCYLPRPGCSNGHLNWVNVKEILAPILDDRFIIVTQSRFD